MKILDTITTKGKLSLGIVFPIESYSGAIAKMDNQEFLAKRAEDLGFSALWFRDVPSYDPTFGDAGQLYDPWIYMTYIMNHTSTIKLATGSLILPLRHPIHTLKSIQSLQNLSKGRLIMGIASGDRRFEYPAFDRDINQKAELFRDSFNYIKALQRHFPIYSSKFYGNVNGSIDILPKTEESTPFLVTGFSGQSIDWIAKHSDGWLFYPRNLSYLNQILNNWKESLKKLDQNWKPYLQSLYIDLSNNKDQKPTSIHLGFKLGNKYLIEHLKMLEILGVNHVILNLKYGERPAEDVLEEIGEYVVPHFSLQTKNCL